MPAPDKLRIPYDDSEDGRFSYVGRLPDGTQFMAFVTGAFPAGQEYYLGDDWRTNKRWLAVIHRFDAEGNHLGSKVAGKKAFGHLEAMFTGLLRGGELELCDV